MSRGHLWSFVRRVLFRLDAESIHHLGILFIRLGIRLGKWPLGWISGGAGVRGIRDGDQQKSHHVFGIPFSSRVGLAAGFDKNAEILLGLPDLGFGFAEIGTVTPRPQPGNQRPRLFRDSDRGALFNRMGFNSLGAAVVSERLRVIRPQLPSQFRVGVNLGKNKDTPLEDASKDYVLAAKAFEDLADYIVMNVSSPNTPGLRSLQTLEALKPIVSNVAEHIDRWKQRPPLLLKLAPELSGETLSSLIKAIEPYGIDGWILTNTLEGSFSFLGTEQRGGWSGEPLVGPARKSLKEVRHVTRKPIISVGGIMTAEEAALRISEGADLIQIYTGWIFKGPRFPKEILEKLDR